MKCKPGRIS